VAREMRNRGLHSSWDELLVFSELTSEAQVARWESEARAEKRR